MAEPTTTISLQTWTIRDSLDGPEAFAASMAKVAAMGYPAVELGGEKNVSADDVKRILEDNGLVCSGTQVSLPVLGDQLAAVVADCRRLETDQTALAACPKDMRSREGYLALSKQLAAIGRDLKTEGITLSYHNHWWELERFGRETGLDLIYGNCDPEFLEAKLDVAWLQKGGADPIAWIRRLADRMTIIHLKDYAVRGDELLLTEVGEGNLNCEGIIEACGRTRLRWYVTEQDRCEREPFEAARISLENLKRYGLK